MDDCTEERVPYDPAPPRRAYACMGWALFAIAAVTIVMQIILSVACRLMDLPDAAWLSWVVTFAPLYLIAMPIGLLILRVAPRQELPGAALGTGNFFLMLLMCFPLMYFGNLIGTLLSLLFSGGTAQNPLAGYAADTSLLKILVMVILAPLLEEFIFRKQLIDRTARYGEKPAILFSALSFGLFHMNLFQFFYAFGLGLLFGYIYLRTRRLRYTFALHAAVNFLGSVVAPAVLSLVGDETLQQLSSGSLDEALLLEQLPKLALVGFYALSLVGLSIAGLVVLILRLRRFVFRPAEAELPKEQIFRTVYLHAGTILFALTCLSVVVLSLIA